MCAPFLHTRPYGQLCGALHSLPFSDNDSQTLPSPSSSVFLPSYRTAPHRTDTNELSFGIAALSSFGCAWLLSPHRIFSHSRAHFCPLSPSPVCPLIRLDSAFNSLSFFLDFPPLDCSTGVHSTHTISSICPNVKWREMKKVGRQGLKQHNKKKKKKKKTQTPSYTNLLTYLTLTVRHGSQHKTPHYCRHSYIS